MSCVYSRTRITDGVKIGRQSGQVYFFNLLEFSLGIKDQDIIEKE